MMRFFIEGNDVMLCVKHSAELQHLLRSIILM